MNISNNVFIVDDDLSVRNALSRLLRVAGYNVRAFACAEDFLDAVDSEMLGCIILDLGLPGITGEELGMKLKDRRDGIKIIILSAVDNPANKG